MRSTFRLSLLVTLVAAATFLTASRVTAHARGSSYALAWEDGVSRCGDQPGKECDEPEF